MTAFGETFPATRTGLFEQVASQLEELILTGRIEVGTKLPSEGELAAHFQVSRPVVREALTQLRERGLIDTVNGSGTYARRPDPDHLADVFLRHLRFETVARPQVIENLYEARLSVEVTAARLAAVRATEADRSTMRTCLDRMHSAAGDSSEWVAADMGFHQAIADGSHNVFFGAFLSPMTKIIEVSMSESRRDPAGVAAGISAHEAILQAIAARDEEGAGRAMTAHLEDSKARLSAVLVVPSGVRRPGGSSSVTSQTTAEGAALT